MSGITTPVVVNPDIRAAALAALARRVSDGALPDSCRASDFLSSLLAIDEII